jgi:hypothetical protein
MTTTTAARAAAVVHLLDSFERNAIVARAIS